MIIMIRIMMVVAVHTWRIREHAGCWDAAPCALVTCAVRSVLYAMALRPPMPAPAPLLVACGSAFRGVHVWDASAEVGPGVSATCRPPLLRLTGHDGAVFAIAWCARTDAIASVSDDRRVCVWHVADALAAAPGGVQSGEPAEEACAASWYAHTARVWACCWGADRTDSGDGRHVLTAGEDGRVRVWRVGARPDGVAPTARGALGAGVCNARADGAEMLAELASGLWTLRTDLVRAWHPALPYAHAHTAATSPQPRATSLWPACLHHSPPPPPPPPPPPGVGRLLERAHAARHRRGALLPAPQPHLHRAAARLRRAAAARAHAGRPVHAVAPAARQGAARWRHPGRGSSAAA